MSSDSDSDSDFGDFGEGTVTVEQTVPETDENGGVAKESQEVDAQFEPVRQVTTVEAMFDCMRKVLAAKERGIELRDKKVLFQDLLKNEKTKKVYDGLFPNGEPLPPVQWRKEPLKRIIMHSVDLKEPEDDIEEHKEYIIQDLLYLKLEEQQQQSLDQLGYKKLNPEEVPDADLSQLLSYQDFDSIPECELPVIHDQFLDAIETVLQELEGLKTEEQELLKDKATYEELITNLVGHTQRIRRDEIADFQKKHKNKFLRK
ncbi:unnamed protein product [Kluyveromyces dobzhanskii CBS 2104]|uniref:WGS project CCBQ000000000 data, contig 00015 n=1 Tax=Kluyveromyces dobzhanskii CBS 2104 TaxID=1427455 RepID=A0A0A8L8J2_9SACH|nr:unnamed protein product [Kluyveromyces dobzhanskii CBS 2104]